MPGEYIEQLTATTVRIAGRELVSFAGCNYLGLAHDGRVRAAARLALDRMGLSTSASRETTGNAPDHGGLEREATLFVTRDDPARAGLLTPDGYTANLAAAQVLAPDHPLAFVDDRAHRSLVDSARGAGMRVASYAHRSIESLGGLLAGAEGPAVVMTDGVFTADGAVAPLDALLGVLRPGDRLLVDDCHGFTVLGEGGRGTCDEFGLSDPRIVVTTTLAKGLGCGGGIVIATKALIDSARVISTAYVCTTPVSPVIAAAGREALRVIRADGSRVERLRRNSERLGEIFGVMGAGAREIPTPIVAFTEPGGAIPGDGGGPDRLRAIEARLRAEGVFVPVMRYPGGPSAWYFRATVTSEHTATQLDLLSRAMGAVLGAAR
jgi:8-amino-7-oxononanoate synthase